MWFNSLYFFSSTDSNLDDTDYIQCTTRKTHVEAVKVHESCKLINLRNPDLVDQNEQDQGSSPSNDLQ